MKSVIFLLVIFTFYSCESKRTKLEPTYQETNHSGSYNNNSQNLYNPDNNYHKDPNYKYEYRTGTSGNYEYNYDISGSDEDGNNVSGNIDIEGKYGSGTIEDEDGNEKNIDVEWIDKGVLEGTDEDGNSYDLEVD